MKRTIIFFTVFSIILSLLTGCSFFKKSSMEDEFNDELYPVSSIVLNEEEAKKLNDKVPVHLYFSNEDGTKLQKEIRYIPMTEAKKSVNNLASVIVKELIKGPTENRGLKSTVPTEAQLRSPVTIEGRVATVDLTKEFVDKHPGGKKAEELTIYSIVNSLTELKEIESVRFTIEGKEQKEFKGSFKFDSKYPRNTSLIIKDAKVSSSFAVDEDGNEIIEDSRETVDITNGSEDSEETVEILE